MPTRVEVTPTGEIMSHGETERKPEDMRWRVMDELTAIRQQMARVEGMVCGLEDRLRRKKSRRFKAQWQVWAVDGGVGGDERFVTAYDNKKMASSFVWDCYNRDPSPDHDSRKGTWYKLKVVFIPRTATTARLPNAEERLELAEELEKEKD